MLLPGSRFVPVRRKRRAELPQRIKRVRRSSGRLRPIDVDQLARVGGKLEALGWIGKIEDKALKTIVKLHTTSMIKLP